MFPSSSYSFLLCFFSLANSNEAVPRPPSSRPYGGLTPQGPAPSGIRGHASFLKVSLFCYVVKVLLIHLEFFNESLYLWVSLGRSARFQP